MDIVISGRNMNITETLQDYVDAKVGRLGRYMDNIGEVRVELTAEGKVIAEGQYVAQMTLRNERGKLLRAEERSESVEAAVDAAVDKMSRQIERYKGRGKHRRRGRGLGLSAEEQIAAYEADLEAEAEPELEIVRRKRFPVAPMDEEEAIEQLELLDHDFYLFFNPETASVNLVYRRKGGGYGILEPELD